MSNQPDASEGLQTAGDITIDELVLIRSDGAEMDIRTLLGEFNLFEDMFKNGLYGNILLLDAGNFVSKFPIVGNEYIRVLMKTPTLSQRIYKTFKIYSITDRMLIQDTGTQSYILHFCSSELFIDMLSPIYGNYSGKVGELVEKIYKENIAIPRNTGETNDETPLVIFGEPDNEITFTSPGWHATHCINWLASRSIAKDYKSPSFLFYETTQAFYFANVEALLGESAKSKSFYREYIYSANNRTNNPDEIRYSKNVDEEYKKVEELEVVETFNEFKNSANGYYANRLITLDLFTKKYETFDYDHVASYPDYKHMEDIAGGGKSPMESNTLRSPASFVQFYPRHEGLFNDKPNNVGDIIEKTLPQRVSVVNELTNFKIVVTVPGRTDAEVGSVVYLAYPDARPRDESDKTSRGEDPLFSGFYMVTAIRHKITLLKHMMIMELVKDSYRKTPENEG